MIKQDKKLSAALEIASILIDAYKEVKETQLLICDQHSAINKHFRELAEQYISASKSNIKIQELIYKINKFNILMCESIDKFIKPRESVKPKKLRQNKRKIIAKKHQKK